jgi:formylglycine-generating enzyme required for sulfatase activity
LQIEAAQLVGLRAQFCRLPVALRAGLLTSLRIWRQTKSPAAQVFEQLVAAEVGLEAAPSAAIWQQLMVQMAAKQSGVAGSEAVWLGEISAAAPFRHQPEQALVMWQAIHDACEQQGLALPISAAYLAGKPVDAERWRVWEQDDGGLRIEPDDGEQFTAPALMRFKGSLFDQERQKIAQARDVCLSAAPLVLESQAGRMLWDVIEKPEWATDCGRDKVGGWAEFKVWEIVQRMRFVPAGRFIMGSPAKERAIVDSLEFTSDEFPQHSVCISDGFWLADTACTQDLWTAVMGSNPTKFYKNSYGEANYPVEMVSWHDVQKFMQKLQRDLPVCAVTLPTEAEWEYACRAGTTTPFSFGSMISVRQVNYDGNYPFGGGGKGGYRQGTVAVKALPANVWGLYQMHGNVWEWCADSPRGYTAKPVLDPGLAAALAPDVRSAAARVLRGGGWSDFAQGARSACRYHSHPFLQFGNAGFRLVFRSPI